MGEALKDETGPSEDAAFDVRATQTGIRRMPILGERRYWPIAIALLAALVLLLFWIISKEGPGQAEEGADLVVSVRVAKAERQTISEEISVIGTIFPREVATVSAKINAQINKMPLLRNRSVRAGEIIVTLESRDIQSQRAKAASALEEA